MEQWAAEEGELQERCSLKDGGRCHPYHHLSILSLKSLGVAKGSLILQLLKYKLSLGPRPKINPSVDRF